MDSNFKKELVYKTQTELENLIKYASDYNLPQEGFKISIDLIKR